VHVASIPRPGSGASLADLALEPRIVFVLGKGGVGRTTIATALARHAAARGQSALVLQWAVADRIGPWFGLPPAPDGRYLEVAPNLTVTNFSLHAALRAYFSDHLHLGLVYRRVIRARPVARMLDIAPGIAEMFFLGQLWWLTALAEREAGLRFERIIVDAPATGHGASLLDVPAMLARMATAGVLQLETRRVVDLMADPVRLGALVVALPEPLVVDETLELVPRITERLGRPPLGLVVNRSAKTLAPDDTSVRALARQLSPRARDPVLEIARDLRARVEVERALVQRVRCPHGSVADLPARLPADIVDAAWCALGGRA